MKSFYIIGIQGKFSGRSQKNHRNSQSHAAYFSCCIYAFNNGNDDVEKNQIYRNCPESC